MIGFGIGAMCFLALLIYTLFFALPFEETYCEENRLRAAYTEGVYGLCRHPGVLWFAGAYFCMWGRWMETWDLFFTYDFLELSVYHFSGSVDFSADIF